MYRLESLKNGLKMMKKPFTAANKRDSIVVQKKKIKGEKT
jgi:hypothetical protein